MNTVDPADPAANATTIRPPRRRTGVVTSFDFDSGLGEITGSDGVTYPFQGVELSDGSRSVEVGTPVTFEPLARFGRWQAGRIDVAPR